LGSNESKAKGATTKKDGMARPGILLAVEIPTGAAGRGR